MTVQWREAKCLLVLLSQVNKNWPNRSKASDGEIGDIAHQHRFSDHNPNSAGVVTALDITNDPAHGLTSRRLAEALLASRDSRIKYVISNRQIASGNAGPGDPWVWRDYNGSNPHEHHMHISVRDEPHYYDDETEWNLAWPLGVPVTVIPPVAGSTKWLQAQLNKNGFKLQEDGYEGPVTAKAIRDYAIRKLKGN